MGHHQCGDPRDFASCGASPAFLATNGSGCCPGRDGKWQAGVCDACNHVFTCPHVAKGFPWGACVAIVVNIGISVGMALQKHAHKVVVEKVTASAKISDEAADAARARGFAREPRWWLGFLLQVGGEIGNLVAYGDANTPSSVVASREQSASPDIRSALGPAPSRIQEARLEEEWKMGRVGSTRVRQSAASR